MRTAKRFGMAAIAAIASIGLSIGAANARGPGGGGHHFGGGAHFGGGHFSGGHFGGRHFGGGFHGFHGGRHFHGGGFGRGFIGGLAFGTVLGSPYYYDYGWPDCYIRRRVVITRWGHRIIRRYRVCY